MAENYSEHRRFFLKALVLVGGAACIPWAQRKAAAVTQALEHPEKSNQGYRETEHVRKYYRTAGS